MMNSSVVKAKRVRLGVSILDELLDRKQRGLLLPLRPDEGDRGGCNIVIRGRPGTGKSTIALQIARAMCHVKKLYDEHGNESDDEPQFFSIYCSLEHAPEAIVAHAEEFGWEGSLQVVECLQDLPETPSQKELGLALDAILEGARNGECSTSPVLLPRLSPRSLRPSERPDDDLFWHRYQEVERLVEAGNWLMQHGQNKGAPELKLLVIDSLNVFGDRPLDREQLYRLFDLFARNGIVGVFVVEEYGEEHGISKENQEDIVEYLADIVIALELAEDQGYSLRTVQVVKSRYQHQLYGKHPFKLVEKGVSPAGESGDLDDSGDSGIVIYPSMHYRLRESHRRTADDSQEVTESKYGSGSEDDPKGYSGFLELDRLGHFHPRVRNCIAVVGERATYKSVIGRNFALRGMVCGYDGLLITLRENLDFKRESIQFSEDLFWDKDGNVWRNRWQELHAPLLIPDTQVCVEPATLLGNPKAEKQYYRISQHEDDAQFGRLTVMNFTPGMLMPEEFVEELLYELTESPRAKAGGQVRRVILDDVARIGVSYPLLLKSPTSSTLFLTALVDLLKGRNIDTMLVAGENAYPGCKQVTDGVIALADVIIRCKFYDIFGQRYVGVTGETVGRSGGPKEPAVPGVFQRVIGEKINRQVYRINTDLLSGLVGFERGVIERPGASLYVFQDTEIHEVYNKGLAVLLHRAFGQPEGEPGHLYVSVESFNSGESAAVHQSLDVLKSKPLNRTIVVTVDEFWTDATRLASGDDGQYKDPALENLENLARNLGYIPDPKKERFIQNNEPISIGRGTTNNALLESLIPLPPDKVIEGIPYYGNVLLLAHRVVNNLTENMRWNSWTCILENARKIKSAVERDAYPVDRLFEFDASADETLSCVFLDLLIGMIADEPFKETNSDLLKKPAEILREQYEGLDETEAQRYRRIDMDRGEAIRTQLIIHAFRKNEDVDSIKELFDSYLNTMGDCRYMQNAEFPPMGPSAAVYCCWYSELRDLIARWPYLSTQLQVQPLPQKGFRGDWFLGIVKGSVSPQLGEQLITILCSQASDYERFAQGVGLPTRRKFVDTDADFLAWPGAPGSPRLRDITDIHQDALSRSGIWGYREFRSILTTLFKQLVGFRAPKRDSNEILQVVSQQIRLFGKPLPPEYSASASPQVPDEKTP